jgi:hypothetical protein
MYNATSVRKEKHFAFLSNPKTLVEWYMKTLGYTCASGYVLLLEPITSGAMPTTRLLGTDRDHATSPLTCSNTHLI